MELSEFSNEFDIFYNSITSNQAPGLDEYEKSVFLTSAQDDVIKAYFNPRENKVQQGFDDSQKRQIDFSSLISTAHVSSVETSQKFDNRSLCFLMPSDLFLFVNEACNDRNRRYVVIPISFAEYDRLMLKPFQYPVKKGIWRLITDNIAYSTDITGSTAININGTKYVCKIHNTSGKNVIFRIQITPDSLIQTVTDVSRKGIGVKPEINIDGNTVSILCKISDAIDNISNYWNKFLIDKEELKPYIGDMNSSDSIFPSIPGESLVPFTVKAYSESRIVELIGIFDRSSIDYTIRYIRRPNPIILTQLPDNLSIQGRSEPLQCELPEELHIEVLKRAVELAKAAYTGDLSSHIALGQASQTNIGMVQSK